LYDGIRAYAQNDEYEETISVFTIRFFCLHKI
jgi:hypothetical protein